MNAMVVEAFILKKLFHLESGHIPPLGVAIGLIECKGFIVVGKDMVPKLVPRSGLEGTHLGLSNQSPIEVVSHALLAL